MANQTRTVKSGTFSDMLSTNYWTGMSECIRGQKVSHATGRAGKYRELLYLIEIETKGSPKVIWLTVCSGRYLCSTDIAVTNDVRRVKVKDILNKVSFTITKVFQIHNLNTNKTSPTF